MGALRESEDRKVWFRNFTEQDYPVPDSGEVMLYDFGARPGDTIRQGLFRGTDYLVVAGFDAVNINGALRKRILFSDFTYSGWIMGMGSERGLLFPSGDVPSNGLWGDLVCFYQDGQEIFHKVSYENCFEPAARIDDRKTGQSGISLHPNPCSGNMVSIEAVQPLSRVILVDTSGRILRTILLQGENSVRLPVSSLVQGLYLHRRPCLYRQACPFPLIQAALTSV